MASERGSLTGKQAQLFLTDTCDLACIGCPYSALSKEKQMALRGRELTPIQWREIIDYLYNNGIRFFCAIGGEPGSYQGASEVISHTTQHSDTYVLLSTSGIHMLHNLALRRSIGEALVGSENRAFNNGIAISFDVIPSNDKLTITQSRELKARQGLELVRKMRREFPGRLIYIANIMVTLNNLSQILKIQGFLEDENIHTNLCTQQSKCFGWEGAIFDDDHLPELTQVGMEMIRRKINGGAVVNSVAYLSQLPEIIGQENYHCWEEPDGNPIIDVGSDGMFRYCNWVCQDTDSGSPGISAQDLINGTVTLDEFWGASQKTTVMVCKGCSWSRRDRGLDPMVPLNAMLLKEMGLTHLDLQQPKWQNLWVQAQKSVMQK